MPPVLSIPPRPADAITGSEFARRTADLPESERQEMALAELRRGNVPRFIRELKPISLSYKHKFNATVWVMPDYLAIGSDQDFLRIPLTLPSALSIAHEFGCSLPTPKLVDAIYQQAGVKLEPRPLPAGSEMRSNRYYLRHQNIIQEQLSHCTRGGIISGHKKDVVITNRLRTHPGRIAIYGWHRLDGRPIQPLSTVHGEGYADYSHGIRLVSTEIDINGQAWSMIDVLRNPALTPLISDEGMIPDAETLVSWNR